MLNGHLSACCVEGFLIECFLAAEMFLLPLFILIMQKQFGLIGACVFSLNRNA